MHVPACRIHVDLAEPPGLGWRVFVPALARFAPRDRAMMALLPVVDINGGLFAAIEHNALPPLDAVGLLLVDPFLNVADAARKLERCGVTAIANVPSVANYIGEAGRAFDAVGYGFEDECRVLERFVRMGFEALGYAASAAAAERLLTAGVRRLVAAPPLGAPAARAYDLHREITTTAGSVPVALHLV